MEIQNYYSNDPNTQAFLAQDIKMYESLSTIDQSKFGKNLLPKFRQMVSAVSELGEIVNDQDVEINVLKESLKGNESLLSAAEEEYNKRTQKQSREDKNRSILDVIQRKREKYPNKYVDVVCLVSDKPIPNKLKFIPK